MSRATLRTVGGSVMLAIPKSMLETLGLGANHAVELRIQDGRLVVEPRATQRYALAELLAQCDPKAAPSTVDREWEEVRPAGREIIS